MIVPGHRTLFAVAVLALLLVLAPVEHRIVLLVIPADLVVLGVCLIQGRKLRRASIEVRAEEWPRLQVGRAESLPYRIVNRSPHTLVVRLFQTWPDEVGCDNSEAEVSVGAGEIVTLALTITPRARGRVSVGPAEVDIRFPGDGARWRTTFPVGDLKVLPSLRGMNEYESLRRSRASNQAGLHRQRLVGSGRDFDQLREYAPDDDFRSVNWKATARRNHPITNVYQAERSQDVLLCLDCGRMMGDPVAGSTTLDHAIDASIMLAHVASRQGDRVGLVLFRDVVHRFIKPATGLAAVNHVIEELVDARAESVFPSYAALLGALRAHQNRRSLVLLFTDLNDPQLAANLAEVLSATSRRHLVVVVSLRDPLLDKIASGPADDRRGLYQVIAARELATERATRTRELQKIGAMVIEADAGSLTISVLNTYLSIKARQMV